jgi:hypothetical protein
MTSLDIRLNSMPVVLTPDLLKDLATLNILVNLSFSPPTPFPRAPPPDKYMLARPRVSENTLLDRDITRDKAQP